MKIPAFRMALLLLSVLLIPAMASADPVNLSVASDASVVQGSSLLVDVNIANVADLYDFQFDLFFNPAVLQVTGIAEGTFLPGAGATIFLPGFVDNGSGNVTFNADTLETAIPGANGNGTLIEFSFNAVSEGTSSLNLDNIILADSQGNLISSSATNGSVTVTTGSVTVPTPEPATLTILATGLLTIGLRRLRR
jgi:cohesin domain-containing protein/PEP-CTERM motif-containing protein